VIPALNEELSIGSVINRLNNEYQIIVIDDGSEDRTAEVARNSGAFVYQNSKNLGYDNAIETGFKIAQQRGLRYLVTIDADGQHDPEFVAEFADLLINGADVVVGRRPRKQRISEVIFGCVTRRLIGIDDPLCGMKGYRMEVFQLVGHFDCYGSVGTELLLYAAATGHTVLELEIPIKDRVGQPRFGSGLKANYRISKACIRGISKFMRAKAKPSRAALVFHQL
jgi:glycosyltransferase involved in cell wall biosynthesis